MKTLTEIPADVHEVLDDVGSWWRRIPGLDAWLDLDTGEIETGAALAELGVTWSALETLTPIGASA